MKWKHLTGNRVEGPDGYAYDADKVLNEYEDALAKVMSYFEGNISRKEIMDVMESVGYEKEVGRPPDTYR